MQLAVLQEKPNLEVVECLIENGADVNAGKPPALYCLASYVEDEAGPECEAVARLLLKCGAQINTSDYGIAFFDEYTENNGFDARF